MYCRSLFCNLQVGYHFAGPLTLRFISQSITWTANGVDTTISVPNGTTIWQAPVAAPSTSYSASDGLTSLVPDVCADSANVIMAVVVYQVRWWPSSSMPHLLHVV